MLTENTCYARVHPVHMGQQNHKFEQFYISCSKLNLRFCIIHAQNRVDTAIGTK